MDQPADQASIDESDEYWDEVADRFEQFDWLNFADEPAHELYLSLAVQAETTIAEPTEVSRQQIEDAVCWARREGMRWDRIAEILGVTAPAARARYGEAAKAVRA